MSDEPPKPNELEVSVFGPGVGECVVLHMGAGNWVVIDSCLGRDHETPVAMEYLSSMGIDARDAVKLIVVTHWHDDHIRGVARLLRECTSAKFACSAALRCTKFLELVAADKQIKLVEHTSGVSEFWAIFAELERRQAGRSQAGPDIWANEGSLLYRSYVPCSVSIQALSPSAQSVTDGLGGIADMVPEAKVMIGRFNSVTPNGTSVAIQVDTPGLHILLGADLERGGDDQHGWRAVVASETRPKHKSGLFKVAHHGSPNADLPEVWSEMMTKEPIAVLTPYAAGRKPRPAKEDVDRIKQVASSAYCSQYPPVRSPHRRSSTVERTMKEVARTRKAIRRVPGHVQARAPLEGPAEAFSVDLRDGAVRL
ncbi:MAG: MBL fold metallo-hydrolase [Planctomycetes bacterium]|jgi:hypothetical protein|nr:MBL fold metallo-hydrolase [Planctomycetota bacterium]